MTLLPKDFKDFLQLLNAHEAEYLLIGGYAVGYHGYPRATADMDIWINPVIPNIKKVIDVLIEFGFSPQDLTADIFLQKDMIVRLGQPPLRIEILTSISGVEFSDCYKDKIDDEIDGVKIKIINLKNLKLNKKAANRFKDLDDLEKL